MQPSWTGAYPSSANSTLQLTPEITTLEADETRHVWVAVEITAPWTVSTSVVHHHHNFALDVQPGRFCILRSVFKSKALQLFPGQSTLAAVEVLVPKWEVWDGNHKRSSLELAFFELEHVLGLGHTHLVTVSLREQLQDVDIAKPATIVSKTLRLPRTNLTSEWSIDPGTRNSAEAATQMVTVHKAVLASISQHTQGPETLQVLSAALHNHRLHPSVVAEARELEAFGKSRSATSMPFLSLPNLHTPPTEASTMPSDELDCTPRIKLTRTPSTASTSTVLRRPDSMTRPAIPEDTAHRIWQLMRKDSKSGRRTSPAAPVALTAPSMLPGILLEPTMAASPGTLQNPVAMEIYAQALRNRRSIGVDTLRSLALGSAEEKRKVGQEATAPWL